MNPVRNGKLKLNITRNIKTIEWLKAELVDGVSSLFKAMIPNRENIIINSLVRLIIAAYVLGRRLGFTYERIEGELECQIDELIEDKHEIDQWFGDLSGLKRHLQERNKF
ncbi:MAG: MazG-like family protein [Halanaerobiales bacterium]|nr:MazG-like family protein [Halanaerobiales bacterium]